MPNTLNDSAESLYPNPKNDGITLFEKFIRHRATIMGYCFAVIFKDSNIVKIKYFTKIT